MRILNIIDEDIVNYKKISMFIAFPTCSMRCNIDCNNDVCQNSNLLETNTIEIDKDKLIDRYLSNPITHAIVLGGLEPFDSPFDLISFVDAFRNKRNCSDDIVIFTGYTEEELEGITTTEYPNAPASSVISDVYK